MEKLCLSRVEITKNMAENLSMIRTKLGFTQTINSKTDKLLNIFEISTNELNNELKLI